MSLSTQRRGGDSCPPPCIPAIWILAALLIASAALAVDPPPVATSPRVIIPLQDHWRFQLTSAADAVSPQFDDGAWETVSLPHSWRKPDNGCYRRKLKIDDKLTAKRLYLRFGAANEVADVFIDGKSIGTHKGGFTAFIFDVTDALRDGNEHVVAIRISNKWDPEVLPIGIDSTLWGGLYRNVSLIAVDPLSIDLLDYAGPGVYVTPVQITDRSAKTDVLVRLRNSDAVARTADLTIDILDAAGQTVVSKRSAVELKPSSASDSRLQLTIPSPHLWQAKSDPYRYRVLAQLSSNGKLLDAVADHFGLRTLKLDSAKGFFLNGKPLDLHGVNKHQDVGPKAWLATAADHDADFATIMELGATMVRLCHYPHDAYTYDLCDRLGLIVWAEHPLNTRITDKPALMENATQQMHELVRQNYNRPSICFWGVANEPRLRPGPDVAPMIKALCEMAKAEDPVRLVTLAAKGGNPVDPGLDCIAYNAYAGWYGRSYDDFPPFLEKTRNETGGKPLGMSEFGAGSTITRHSLTPKMQDYTEEYQCLLHEAYYRAIKDRPDVWCKLVWIMFDFTSDGRKEADTPFTNNKGLLTLDRKTKKDAFYWYKANWSDEPFVHITSRRFTPRSESVAPVKVYSNCEEVELRVNGNSLGSKKSDDHIFLWPDVKLASGASQIHAVGTKAGKEYSDSCQWELQADKP